MSKTTPRLRVMLDEQQSALSQKSSMGVTGRRAFLTKGSPSRASRQDRRAEAATGALPQLPPLNIQGAPTTSSKGSGTSSGRGSKHLSGRAPLKPLSAAGAQLEEQGDSARGSSGSGGGRGKKTLTDNNKSNYNSTEPCTEPSSATNPATSITPIVPQPGSGRNRSRSYHQDTNGAIKPASKPTTPRSESAPSSLPPLPVVKSPTPDLDREEQQRQQQQQDPALAPVASASILSTSGSKGGVSPKTRTKKRASFAEPEGGRISAAGDFMQSVNSEHPSSVEGRPLRQSSTGSFGGVGSFMGLTTEPSLGAIVRDGPPIRGDVNTFLERMVKESRLQSHMNLPHLLAHLLPAIGITDLNAIDTASSGDSSFYIASSEDSSNVFLSRGTAMGPFVSHMTFHSVNDPDTGEASDYQPVELEGALMFLDMSGYSKITAALQERGAHAISDAVNGYMTQLLDVIVDEFNGDVLKFAGDAVMVAWTYDADMERSCLSAAMCALKLQEACGVYPIDLGEDEDEDQEPLMFRIHIGLAAGKIQSEVFQPKYNSCMQRAYHFIHGDLFSTIGPVVDTAKSGEVAMSSQFMAFVEEYVNCTAYPSEETAEVKLTPRSPVKLNADPNEDSMESSMLPGADMTEAEAKTIYQLTSMRDSCQEALEDLGDDSPVLPQRPRGMEAQFIHPSIVKKLHFGVKPDHMAEMRLLTVLFIHKSNLASSVDDWFYEAQEILDVQRCPIVQIIDDDKGIHLVAAVGLFVAEPDPTMVGLRAARALKEREVECTTGMATGMVFCGIVGSKHACRWDITGQACVRAARLMQYAIANKLDVAVDESLREKVVDVSQLTEAATGVELKGSPKPVTIYTLSEKSNEVTSRIISSGTIPMIHEGALEDLQPVIEQANGSCRRGVGIVSGPVGSGKKTLCVRAAIGFVRCLHQTTRNSLPLTLALTLAAWFSDSRDVAIAETAKKIEAAHGQHLISKTMHLCLDLVALSIEKSMSTCLIVHHAHFLDSYSLSLLHQIHNVTTAGAGRWVSMLTHYPLFEALSVSKLKSAVSHAKCTKSEVPVAYIGEVSKEDYTLYLKESNAWSMNSAVIELMMESGGGVVDFNRGAAMPLAKEYFRRRAIFEKTGVEMEELSRVNKRGEAMTFAPGMDCIRTTPWTVSSPEHVSRLTSLYDVLPPRLQTVLKVIAAMCKQGLNYHPLISDVGWMTVKLVSKRNAKEVIHDVRILKDLHILKTDTNMKRVYFQLPAMRDMMLALCTPDQVTAINVECAKKYEAALTQQEKAADPAYILTLARFNLVAYGPTNQAFQMYMQRCWNMITDLKAQEAEREEKATVAEAVEEVEEGQQHVTEGKDSTAGKKKKTEPVGCGNVLSPVMAAHPYFQSHKGDTCTTKLVIALVEHEFRLDSIRFKFDPKQLFNAEPRGMDVLPDTEGKLQGKIPDVVVDVKNYVAPICLGPLCDCLVQLAVLVRQGYIATVTKQMAASQSEEVMAALNEYMSMVWRWEKVVPVADVKDAKYSEEMRDKERAMLEKYILPMRTEKAAIRNCEDFLTYTTTVVAARAKRATTYAGWMKVLPSRVERDSPVLARAFHRLEVDNLGNITTDSFHGSLMALATEDWSPTNPQVTLEWIRDSCLKKNTTTLAEFKSFLYLYCVL